MCQGQTGVVYCVPVITDATDYLWTLPDGATITAGANTHTIIVNFSTDAISGIVSVQGINSCGAGTASADFPVTVNALSIASDNQIVCAGSSALFSVTASGTGQTYQWRRGNVNLINGGNISGTTSALLTFNPVSIDDAAPDYNVIVTGACPLNDTLKNICLGVNMPPEITTEPFSQIVYAESSVDFFVTAIGSGLTYQWRKGTLDLIDGGNISGATTDILTINPANISDTASNYNVVISGTCFPISNSVEVSLSMYPTGFNVLSAEINNNPFIIYPNPFTTSIHFIINDVSQINETVLMIYNALGAEVINTSITKPLTSLKTVNFVPGIYFYKIIKDGTIIQSGKLISL